MSLDFRIRWNDGREVIYNQILNGFVTALAFLRCNAPHPPNGFYRVSNAIEKHSSLSFADLVLAANNSNARKALPNKATFPAILVKKIFFNLVADVYFIKHTGEHR